MYYNNNSCIFHPLFQAEVTRGQTEGNSLPTHLTDFHPVDITPFNMSIFQELDIVWIPDDKAHYRGQSVNVVS